MRMWMLPTKFLCQKHLLGEHGELHKHRHNFEKHHSIAGRISPFVAIEPANMEMRHNELVVEMYIRGYNHKSPYTLPDLSYLPDYQRNAKVNYEYNLADLIGRCPECAKRISQMTLTSQ